MPLIYGDEGVTIPPYTEFTKVHRINTGIEGVRDAGLTTGHGSYMADAWGGDEFVDGPEFTMSGANHGNPQHFSQGQYLGSNPGGPTINHQNSQSRTSQIQNGYNQIRHGFNQQSNVSPRFGFSIGN